MGDNKATPSPKLAGFRPAPFPVADFRKVLAVFINVFLVLDQFVLKLLLEADPLLARLRQPVYRVHHQMETVQIIEHGHVKGGGNGALFLVAAHMDVVVVGAPLRVGGTLKRRPSRRGEVPLVGGYVNSQGALSSGRSARA